MRQRQCVEVWGVVVEKAESLRRGLRGGYALPPLSNVAVMFYSVPENKPQGALRSSLQGSGGSVDARHEAEDNETHISTQ